jgi:MoxR-like ATPase
MPNFQANTTRARIDTCEVLMVNSILIGLLTNGHILLEGVPGLAKTTTVKAVALAIDLNFKRILPSDIIGAQIFDMKTSEFKIKKGPIFTNLIT